MIFISSCLLLSLCLLQASGASLSVRASSYDLKVGDTVRISWEVNLQSDSFVSFSCFVEGDYDSLMAGDSEITIHWPSVHSKHFGDRLSAFANVGGIHEVEIANLTKKDSNTRFVGVLVYKTSAPHVKGAYVPLQIQVRDTNEEPLKIITNTTARNATGEELTPTNNHAAGKVLSPQEVRKVTVDNHVTVGTSTWLTIVVLAALFLLLLIGAALLILRSRQGNYRMKRLKANRRSSDAEEEEMRSNNQPYVRM